VGLEFGIWSFASIFAILSQTVDLCNYLVYIYSIKLKAILLTAQLGKLKKFPPG